MKIIICLPVSGSQNVSYHNSFIRATHFDYESYWVINQGGWFVSSTCKNFFTIVRGGAGLVRLEMLSQQCLYGRAQKQVLLASTTQARAILCTYFFSKQYSWDNAQ